LPPALFLRATPRTKLAGEMIDFVRQSAGSGDRLDQLHGINQMLRQRFELAPMGHDRGFSAAAAFVLEHACARDLAQMFVAAARGLGIPARYVSGYRAADSQHSCSASHAWAEAHVQGLGWVSFDPSAAVSTDEHYVRVAIGLDASGAAPIVGQRIGPGEEALDVDVHVDRLNGEE
jgi:transglutaminase-like putative cysteine protease